MNLLVPALLRPGAVRLFRGIVRWVQRARRGRRRVVEQVLALARAPAAALPSPGLAILVVIVPDRVLRRKEAEEVERGRNLKAWEARRADPVE